MSLALIATVEPSSSTEGRVSAREVDEDDALSVVENFLQARGTGDFSGAASWCASLLELQDTDEAWFVDHATFADWLRQLNQEYLIDRVVQPYLDGKSVTWSERLTRRGSTRPDAGPARMTVTVHAVIRENKITYLSGPYPPLPLRTSSAAPGEPSYFVHSNDKRSVPPVVLFLGSTAGVVLLVFLSWLAGRVIGRTRLEKPRR
jgi:hypothetical protein